MSEKKAKWYRMTRYSRKVGDLVPAVDGMPWLKVVEGKSCKGCYFNTKKRRPTCTQYMLRGECNKKQRHDKTPVIFKRLSFVEYCIRRKDVERAMYVLKKAISEDEDYDYSIRF